MTIRLILCLLVAQSTFGAWTFDWATRTDAHGKPAGCFEATPFPITESSTAYTVTNDENPTGKTFTLGTLYFVDGAAGSEGDGSWASPFKTVVNGISSTPAGNYTLVVRGAHDAFDGYYTNTLSDHLTLKAGTDDTHRWMMVGYGQERPTLVGRTNVAADIIGQSDVQNTYATVQRFRFTENDRGAIMFGKASPSDWYMNVIDCLFTNITTRVGAASYGNAFVYFTADCRFGWISHCTGIRTFEHGFKIGDGASDIIVEWCVAGQCGYWPTIAADTGITNWSAQVNQPSACFDFPNDQGVCGRNNTLRYSIAYHGLAQGVQIRNCSNMQCYANEVYNCPNLTGNATLTNASTIAYSPQGQIWIGGLSFSGPTTMDKIYVHGNVIHDNLDTNTESCGIAVTPVQNAGASIFVYNNLLYANGNYGIRFRTAWAAFTNRLNYVCNNTVYQNSNQAAISIPTTGTTLMQSGECFILNNVIWQAGTGACLGLPTYLTAGTDYGYNLYYYPSGSLGTTAAATDVASGASTDPQLTAFTTPFVAWMGYPAFGSPVINAGTNLAATFTDDFRGLARGAAFDIGAYEYAAPRRLSSTRLSLGKIKAP